MERERRDGEVKPVEIASPSLPLCLPPALISRQVSSWLREDVPGLEFGAWLVGSRPVTAGLWLKSRAGGVVCGAPWVTAIFDQLGCLTQWLAGEGQRQEGPGEVARVRGEAWRVLQGERTALNVLARASGIATSARRAGELARGLGWRGSLAGTRKCAPGMRLVEKYALEVGGASSHRYSLSSAPGLLLIKDNHVNVVGSVGEAVRVGRSVCGVLTRIEVEVRDLSEAREAARAGGHIIMLDNFTPQTAVSVAETLKREYPGVLVEVSGGIDPTNLPEYLSPHIDLISLGCLTQASPPLDYSLRVSPDSEGGGGRGIRVLSQREGERLTDLCV